LQFIRPPPVLPVKVAYMDFEDFQKTVEKKCPEPWRIQASTTKQMAFWHEEKKMRVEVDETFSIMVKVDILVSNLLYPNDLLAPFPSFIAQRELQTTPFNFDIQKEGLKSLLALLGEKALCQGTHESSAAELPNVMRGSHPRWWAVNCECFVNSDGDMCKSCLKIFCPKTPKKPVHKNTPLSSHSKQQVDNLEISFSEVVNSKIHRLTFMLFF
jgi:hypothetical protein